MPQRLGAKVAETFEPVHHVETPSKRRNTETLYEFRYVNVANPCGIWFLLWKREDDRQRCHVEQPWYTACDPPRRFFDHRKALG